ncbi:phosphoenolpyruvate synthase [Pyrodictium occultum]|uniref:Phosphoenolpyruvate synthase n=1 Tax=Pyrodictium occultum TaxID=2309 RepID=A0A0V8RWD1_PYROC|nr:phosphoenolpyruvate synthase [Pyrodictium occultum]KSW12328.1 phosphoenolpyruvate synthase [Pyrodictium occultum]
MAGQRPLVVWIEELRANDVELAGGKGANLGELVSAGVPVPPGFVVTTEAYKKFIESTGLRDKIKSILENLDVNDTRALEEASRKIREMIMAAEMPREIAEVVKSYYIELGKRVGIEEPLVAVRSSASAEDLPEASFAGQQDTYLNVKGANQVVEKVKACWASLFTARAIFYRAQHGIDHFKTAMAVVVQKMVNARSAGVMFTLHPVTGDTSVIVIESSWGLGEAVVAGKVTPDEFVVDKKTLEIVDKKISRKEIMITYDPETGGTVEVKLPEDKATEPSLSDDEVKALARYGLMIEKHYNHPMDIEWAIDKDIQPPNNIFIVQARYETVWSRRKAEAGEAREAEAKAAEETGGRVLVRGLPASPGVATGVARVILDPHSPEAQEFREGDVLVTRMTDPDWVPLMKKAAAIVTDEGGMTSHAAIVSRELGIPAVVGTGNATKVIKTGTLVTVDGSRGVVYEGRVEISRSKAGEEAAAAAAAIDPETLRNLYPVTGTKIYMNLGEPDVIDKYVHLPFDGIGLMRIEFILTDWIGYHPLYLIETGKADFFVDRLAEGIAKVASAIYPRPVVVRFSDFKTNEYRGLKGGEKYEPEERNPMLGWRGVSRYIHPAYEKAFRLEVRAIKKVRDEMGLKNVWVMLPFVRTTWEVEKVLEIMADEGLQRGKDFKVWIMAEVPSVVLLADEFSKLVDGFSIGSNDLTQLVLGVDRDSQLLAGMGYFDERDPAVLRAIKMLIDAAHRHGRTVSICGQAPSVYPEVVEFLVASGIDSISVNPDAVIPTRRLVASIERRLMMRRLEEVEKALRELKGGMEL